jgi:hypothetical protein
MEEEEEEEDGKSKLFCFMLSKRRGDCSAILIAHVQLGVILPFRCPAYGYNAEMPFGCFVCCFL